MTYHPSSIAAPTSDVGERLQSAVRAAETVIDPNRLQRLREIQKRLDDLRERGMLRPQQYSLPTRGEIERQFFVRETKEPGLWTRKSRP